MTSSEASIRTAAITTGAKPIPANGSLQVGYPNNLSMTPGGTLYSTTPGGTKIVYDRTTMLLIGKNSPMSHTPPSGMAMIPGVTMPTPVGEKHLKPKIPLPPQPQPPPQAEEEPTKDNKDEMFQMDD